jgi:hypothetical protein
MSSLSFRYEPNPGDEYTGRLWLTLNTERFSGRGFFWAHRRDLTGFAKELAAYPISASKPPRYIAGYNQADGADAVLLVSVKPKGALGGLLVEAAVSDLYERDQRLTASFIATYSDVATFLEQLSTLADGGADEAVLTGQ